MFYLLILLTALRGLVGDAMALEMMRMPSAQSTVMSQEVHAPAHQAASPPCHDAASSSPDSAAQTSSECTVCQVCHSPALQRRAALPELLQPVASFPARDASKWASADVAQQQKPPVF